MEKIAAIVAESFMDGSTAAHLYPSDGHANHLLACVQGDETVYFQRQVRFSHVVKRAVTSICDCTQLKTGK